MVRLLGMIVRILIQLAFLRETFVGCVMVLLRNTVVLFEERVYEALCLPTTMRWPRSC